MASAPVVSLATRVRPVLGHAAALLAAVAPVATALWLSSPGAQWRDDVALVRGLGLSPSPGAGAVSTLLFWTTRLVPLGTVALRSTLVSALGAAAAGYLLFGLARRTLDGLRRSALNPLLALLAALSAALSPALLRESCVGAGATVAVALALAALSLDESTPRRRLVALLGALSALLMAESVVGAVALALALVASWVAARRALVSPSPRSVLVPAAIGLVGASLLVALPVLLRPLAPASWVGLGLGHGFGDLSSLDVMSLRGRALETWARSVGLTAVALGALGALAALRRPDTRSLAAPWLAFALLDAVLPPVASGVLGPDPLASVRALAICAAAVLAAVGVQQATIWLRERAWAFARPAAGLIVAWHAALAALSAEDGLRTADRGLNAGADAWTDEALERLPPSAMVMTGSEAATWRLWAARLGASARPDVLVVPRPLLGRGKLAGALLGREPSLGVLLRDLSATGALTEFGLSSIADARPLYLDLTDRDDRRIDSHLVADHLWLRFTAQPLGLSDRRSVQTAATSTFYRVVGACRRDEPHDEATLEVLAAHAHRLASVHSRLGDREGVQQALLELAALHREPPADEAAQLLDPRAHEPRGRRARR